jgi:hypothetical protein
MKIFEDINKLKKVLPIKIIQYLFNKKLLKTQNVKIIPINTRIELKKNIKKGEESLIFKDEENFIFIKKGNKLWTEYFLYGKINNNPYRKTKTNLNLLFNDIDKQYKNMFIIKKNNYDINIYHRNQKNNKSIIGGTYFPEFYKKLFIKKLNDLKKIVDLKVEEITISKKYYDKNYKYVDKLGFIYKWIEQLSDNTNMRTIQNEYRALEKYNIKSSDYFLFNLLKRHGHSLILFYKYPNKKIYLEELKKAMLDIYKKLTLDNLKSDFYY